VTFNVFSSVTIIASLIRRRDSCKMIVLEYLTIWTYLEVAVYVSLYRKLFSILAKNLDHPTFRKKWSISRGTAVGIANLIVSGLFGLGASLSGFSILFLRLNNYQQNGAPKSEGKGSRWEKTDFFQHPFHSLLRVPSRSLRSFQHFFIFLFERKSAFLSDDTWLPELGVVDLVL